MPLLRLKEQEESLVPTPQSGRVNFFFGKDNQKFSYKKPDGTIETLGQPIDDRTIYQSTYSEVSGDTSVYSVVLTDRPTPSENKSFYLKLPTTNAYSKINILIQGVGSFRLFKNNGLGFNQQEFKPEMVIELYYDGDKANLVDTVSENTLTTTLTELNDLKANNLLTPGYQYKFTYTAKYMYNGTLTDSSTPETFIATAVAGNKLDSSVVSDSFPQDIIIVDFNHPTHGIKVKRRTDPIKQLSAPFDWRNIKFRRGRDLITNQYIIADPTHSQFSADSLAVYAFDNSRTGGNCSNIYIESIDLNDHNSALSGIAQYNIEDANNVFYNGKNLRVSGYFNTFYNTLVADEDDMAYGNMTEARNISHSLFVHTGHMIINNSKRLEIRGIRTNGDEFFDVKKISITNCEDLYIAGDSNAVILENVRDSGIRGGDQVTIRNSENIWMTDCVKTDIVNCRKSIFKNTNESYYQGMESFLAFDSIKEKITNGRNFATWFGDTSNIENLRDVYEQEDYSCVITKQNTTNDLKQLTATISSATFDDGDIIKVDNSMGIVFDRAVSIGFDTNSDTVIDTPVMPIRTGNFTNKHMPVGDVFYMVYYQGEFFRIPSNINSPYMVNTIRAFFNGMNSNFEKEISVSSNTININNNDNDYSHIGVFKINHSSSVDLVSISHSTGKYPKLRRTLKSNADGASGLTVKHQSSPNTNQIISKSGDDILLDTEHDYVEVIKSDNVWKILDYGTY